MSRGAVDATRDTTAEESSNGLPGRTWPSAPAAAIIGAAVLGGALRVHYIQLHHLWTDETQSRLLATLPWRDFVRWFLDGQDFHPPLYFTWLRLARLAAGMADVQVLRYVDLAWFPATLGVLTWFATRNPRYRGGAAATAILVALGPTFVYLGAELRSYEMLLFLSVALLVLAVEFLRGAASGRSWFLISVVLGVAIPLTHYVGFLVVASILGAVLSTALIVRRPILPALAVAATVGALLVPYSPILLEQLGNQDTIYSTSFREASSFVMRGLNPVGTGIIAVAAAMLIVDLVRRRASGRTHAVGFHGGHPAVLAPLLTTIIFLAGAGVTSAVRDVDLLNFGASLFPVAMLTLAAANYLSERTGPLVILVAAVLAPLSIVLALSSNQDPSVFEPNRISTVDVLLDATLHDPSLGSSFGRDVTIIHVDWYTPNDYFVEEASRILPLARVEAVPIPMIDQIGDTLDTLDPGGRTLLITRAPVQLVLDHLPADMVAEHVGPTLTELVFLDSED